MQHLLIRNADPVAPNDSGWVKTKVRSYID
jgi:hypothetical protein